LPWRAFLEKFDAIEWILDDKPFSFSHAQRSSENAQIVVHRGWFRSSDSLDSPNSSIPSGEISVSRLPANAFFKFPTDDLYRFLVLGWATFIKNCSSHRSNIGGVLLGKWNRRSKTSVSHRDSM